MKAKIFLIIISFLFFSGNIFSQSKNEVVEATIKRTDFSDTKVTLKYELPAGNFPNTGYEVTLRVKLPNEEIDVQVGLGGDHGKNVMPSKNLSLIWNFTEEGFVKSDVKDAEMIITAKRTVTIVNVKPRPISNKKIKLPSVALPSGMIAAGVGIIGLGISQELKAQDDYAFYKENVLAGEVVQVANEIDGVEVLEDLIITDEVRQEYYDDAKSKRGVGIVLMTLGGLTSAAGTYFLKKKLNERKKIKKGFSFQPDVQFNNNTSTSVGGKVVFTF